MTLFYNFQESASADAALQAEELHQVDGRRLRVERAKVNRTLFVAKFSLALLPAELRKLAESFGEVESVTIIKHHVTNKSKGCGFIKYKYREDAADAFTGLKAKNKKWVVEWATSANDPELLGVAKNLVYVGGLPFDRVTEALLREHFSVYGSIEEVSIIHPNPHFLRRDSNASTVPLSPTSQANSTHSTDASAPSPAHPSVSHESADRIVPLEAGSSASVTGDVESANHSKSLVSGSSSTTATSEQDTSSKLSSSSTTASSDSRPHAGDEKSDQQGLTTKPSSVVSPVGADGQSGEVSIARSAARGDSTNLGPTSTSSGAPSTSNSSSISEATANSKVSSDSATDRDQAASGLAEESTPVAGLGTPLTDSTSNNTLDSHTTPDSIHLSSGNEGTDAQSTSSSVPLINGKPVTSYAFITFTEPHAAAAAIENEDGSTFLGEGPIRVQYCETPDMKLRKKLAKMRDVYPATGSPVVIGDPTAATYNAALYGHSHVPHPHAGGLAGRTAPTLVPGPNGSYVSHHPHHVQPMGHHRGHPHAQVSPYAYFQGANPSGGYVNAGSPMSSTTGSNSSAASSAGGMIGNLGVSPLGGAAGAGAAPGYWSNAVGSNPNDPNGWYYVGPTAPLSINVPSKDLMLDLSGLSLDPTSPVAVPLGFPFSPSPTFAPLGFPPMSQLSPLTGPGMPYFPLPTYGLASSSGSGTSPSSPSSTHSNQPHSAPGSNHSQSTATTPTSNSAHQAPNANTASGSPSAGKASASPTVTSANKSAAKV